MPGLRLCLLKARKAQRQGPHGNAPSRRQGLEDGCRLAQQPGRGLRGWADRYLGGGPAGGSSWGKHRAQRRAAAGLQGQNVIRQSVAISSPGRISYPAEPESAPRRVTQEQLLPALRPGPTATPAGGGKGGRRPGPRGGRRAGLRWAPRARRSVRGAQPGEGGQGQAGGRGPRAHGARGPDPYPRHGRRQRPASDGGPAALPHVPSLSTPPPR